MGQEKNQTVLRRIRKGDAITARYLNGITTAVNRNTKAISGPRNLSRASASGGSDGAGVTDLSFTETSRTETTVQVTDSNGDTHDVNQIDQVELVNSAGDVMTLIFNNPE